MVGKGFFEAISSTFEALLDSVETFKAHFYDAYEFMIIFAVLRKVLIVGHPKSLPIRKTIINFVWKFPSMTHLSIERGASFLEEFIHRQLEPDPVGMARGQSFFCHFVVYFWH